MKQSWRWLLVVAILAGSFHQALAQPTARSEGRSEGPRSAASAPAKILLSSHRGDATILTLSDPDSDKAEVTFRIELDDAIERCLREPPPDDINPAEVARCAKQVMDLNDGKPSKRRAMCSKNTVYTEFGNYSLVGTGEPQSNGEGNKKSIRTDWKDHRNEKIVGNCSACRTPEIINTFEVLCPATYKAKFDGFAAY
ncbi:exported protein of unknown function [Bradyrhizobium sp. ORS 285]|nr:exported hypothetical protein [Bradyrhizobium sp. ORS 285]SMX58280.1 exported protein of unknown function [Bradyrhizobium sp. ORS 285]